MKSMLWGAFESFDNLTEYISTYKQGVHLSGSVTSLRLKSFKTGKVTSLNVEVNILRLKEKSESLRTQARWLPFIEIL